MQTKNKITFTPLLGYLVLFIFVILVIISIEISPFFIARPFPQIPQTAQDYYLLGKHYLKDRDQFVKSIEMSRKALALNPKFGAAYITIGLAYAGQGEFDKAIEYYNKAVPLLILLHDKSNLQVAYHDIGIMYDRKKNDQKAWEYFHKAYDLGAYKDPYIKTRLDPRVRKSLETDQYQGFKKVEDADKYGLPSEIRAMIDDYRKEIQLGKTEDVIRECNGYLKQNPTTPYLSSFKEILAFAYLSDKKFNESLKVSQELLLMDLNDESKAFVRFNIAYIYALQRNYTASMAAYDEVIKYYPKYGQIDLVYLGKAGILMQQKKYYEAANLLNYFIEKHPADPQLLDFQFLLTRAYLRLGDRLRAYELMQKTGEMKKEWMFVFLDCLILILILFVFLGIIKWFFRKKWKEDPEKDIFLWPDLKLVLACTIFIPTAFSIVISFIYIKFYLSSDFFDPVLIMGILFEAFFFGLVTYFYRNVYQLRSDQIGLVSRGFKTDILLPLAVVGSVFLMFFLFAIIFSVMGIPQIQQPIVTMTKRILVHYSFINIATLFFLIVIIGPYVEELVFRGFVFRILYKYMDLFWAVLLSAFLWASSHYFTPMLVVIFIQGLILGVIYHKTKSLVPCIVTHMLWNSFVFLMILFSINLK